MSFLKKFAEKLKGNTFLQKNPKGINTNFSSFKQPEGVYNPNLISLPPRPKEDIQESKNAKPGSEWLDDDDEQEIGLGNIKKSGGFSKEYISPFGKKAQNNNQEVTKQENSQKKQNVLTKEQTRIIDPEELQQKNIDYELKVVQDVVHPGGARIKPSEQVLKELGKQCESLNAQLICSIFFSFLGSEDFTAKMKIKTLFAIEYLVKINEKFKLFFQQNSGQLKNQDFEDEEENDKQKLSNLITQITNFLEGKSEKKEPKPRQQAQAQLDLFEDQNDDSTKNQANHNDLLDLGEKKTQQKKVNAFEFINKKKPLQQASQEGNQSQTQEKQVPQQQKKVNAFSFINKKKDQNQQQQQQQQQIKSLQKDFSDDLNIMDSSLTTPKVNKIESQGQENNQKQNYLNEQLYDLNFETHQKQEQILQLNNDNQIQKNQDSEKNQMNQQNFANALNNMYNQPIVNQQINQQQQFQSMTNQQSQLNYNPTIINQQMQIQNANQTNLNTQQQQQQFNQYQYQFQQQQQQQQFQNNLMNMNPYYNQQQINRNQIPLQNQNVNNIAFQDIKYQNQNIQKKSDDQLEKVQKEIDPFDLIDLK